MVLAVFHVVGWFVCACGSHEGWCHPLPSGPKVGCYMHCDVMFMCESATGLSEKRVSSDLDGGWVTRTCSKNTRHHQELLQKMLDIIFMVGNGSPDVVDRFGGEQ